MVQSVPAPSLYRSEEGLGVWEHRGKVAAVGIGHAPTWRRWPEDPQTSIGALSLLAIRKAVEDSGVRPGDVDGLVLAPDTTTGAFWPADRPVPEDFLEAFETSSDPMDGLSKLSEEWLLKNLPEFKNIKVAAIAPRCMSHVLAAAIQMVGDGLSSTCVAVKGWHNFAGRHYQGGENAKPTVEGPRKFSPQSIAGPLSFATAVQFQRYLYKYNKTHEMLAPFVVNSRRNGLLFPEGYWAQHRPEPLTVEDYNSARWIAKPANLFDNDLPIHTAGAYVLTTAERAKDLRQKPVYVLGHAGHGVNNGESFDHVKPRSMTYTLEEIEECAAATGRKIYESAGISPSDVSFENMYDGFSLFHVFHVEGLGYAGIGRGEALDLFQSDISIEGPNPVSPSGGNLGSGRTRFWSHTDSMQQIQGRAGLRQIKKPAEIGVSGGPMPTAGNYIVWSATPN